MAEAECTNANIWEEWFPESALADLLSGENVVANIGQVQGVFKKALQREIRAGRLVTWKGKWFPQAGAPYGIGPDKTCYGVPAIRDYWADFKAGVAARAAQTQPA